MASFKVKIDSLTTGNYSVWKTIMESTLKGQNLWDYVLIDKEEEEDDEVEQAHEKAKALMYSNMSNDQIAATGVCVSARDLWLKIRENHEGAASTQKSVAYTEFLKLRHNKNESITAFAGRFETALGKLESLGHKADEDLKKHVFSHTLPQHMKNTVSMFTMANPDGTVSELISQVKIFHHGEASRDNQQASAFYASGRPNGRRNNQGNRPPPGQNGNANGNGKQCTYCKYAGHTWQECRKLKADNERKKKFGQGKSYNAKPSSNGQLYRPPQTYRPTQPYRPAQQDRAPQYQRQQQAPRFQNNSRPQQATDHRAMYTNNVTQKPVVHSGAFIAHSLPNTGGESSWIVDSGASSHMTPNRQLLVNYTEFTEPELITIGDGTWLEALGKGDIPFRSNEFTGDLTSVLWVPGLKANLFSVGKVLELECSVQFNYNDARVYFYRNDELVLTGERKDDSNYFLIEMRPLYSNADATPGHAFMSASLYEWHKRLAHCSIDTVKALAKSDAVTGMKVSNVTRHECEPCIMGKLCRAHHPQTKHVKADEKSAVLHLDTVGPMPTQSLGGARYIVLSTEEYSGYYHFGTFESKAQIADGVKLMISKAELESGRTVKAILTDNGTEFKNHNLSQWLTTRGTVHLFSTPYVPEQNGLIERNNRTVIEAMRVVLYDSGLHEDMWGEALNTVVYTLNRITTYRNPDKTRYEMFRNEKPNISNLRIFGQPVIYKHMNIDGKLAQKGQKGYCVGYTDRSNTYRIYLDKPTPRIIESCDVKFLTVSQMTEDLDLSVPRRNTVTFESAVAKRARYDGATGDRIVQNDPPMAVSSFSPDDNSSSDTESYTTIEEQEDPKLTITEVLDPDTGRQTRSKRDLTNVHIRTLTKSANQQIKSNKSNHVAMFSVNDEPMDIKDAQRRPDWPQWQKAMDEELDALYENKTWILVDKPPGQKTVKNKWVFKIKHTPTGEIERYKARLVAKGFTQIENIDYKETYAPVASHTMIRLFLAVANQHQMKIMQFDIKTAFLYGDLDETIYMEHPTGYANPENKVCLLKKSLYGLKQAPRNWNSKFNEFLEKFNLHRAVNDKCLYFNHDKSLLLVIYVDDALVASRNEKLMRDLISHLEISFKLKTMECKMFLGMEINHDLSKKEITLTQANKIDEFLKRFNMQDCNPVGTPEQVGAILPDNVGASLSEGLEDPNLEESNEPLPEEYPFLELRGSLQYLVSCTRPDIAHAVSMASRTGKPTIAHWQALKRILRYLKGTKSLGIRFRWENPSELIGYSDADYANDVATRKSNTGYCIFYGGAPIAWCCQRQAIITLSTTEAEFVAGCELVKEMIPIRDQLIELGEIAQDQPAKVFIDNQSAIKLATSESAQQRTKHIDIRSKWLTEAALAKKISVEHIKGDEQVADILTKPLPKPRFTYHRGKLLMNSLVLLAMVALISPTQSLAELTLAPDYILEKSNYEVITEDRQNYLTLQLPNPCDTFFNYTSSLKTTEKLISKCYQAYAETHLAPLSACIRLQDIGPNLTYVPQNYNCAVDTSEGAANIRAGKCEVTRNKGRFDSDAEAAKKLQQWTELERKMKNLPILSRQKRFPIVAPIVGLWAGIVSAMSYKSYSLGQTNSNSISEIANVTNRHTEIFQDTIRYYQDIRDSINQLTEHAIDRDNHYDINHSFSDENEGGQHPLVRNLTKQFKFDEDFLNKINSAARQGRIPDSLTLVDIDSAAKLTDRSSLKTCKYGLVDKHLNLYLDFTIPLKDKDAVVHEVVPMDHYKVIEGDNETATQYCYDTYVGPKYVFFNRTASCVTGLNEKRVWNHAVRSQTCTEIKNDLDTPDIWKTENCTTTVPAPQEDKTYVHMVQNWQKIYCYPHNITVEDQPEQPCPNSSFILPAHAKFSFGKVYHTGGMSDVTITRKVRSPKDPKPKQTITILDDDFDQKCEPSPTDNQTVPHTVLLVHLESPDEDPPTGAKPISRKRRSAIPPPSLSQPILTQTPAKIIPAAEPVTTPESTDKPKLKVAEGLRNLTKNLDISLNSLKTKVMNLPASVNISNADLDSFIDTPINMVSDGIDWVIKHLKAVTSAIGLLTCCMVFVMIMPLVELIFVGIRLVKIPITLWITSARRATNRMRQIRTEIELPLLTKPKKKAKWHTGGKSA